MPQYAILGTHNPEGCPSSNRAVREFVKKGMPQFPGLAEKLGVKVTVNVHLDPRHMTFTLVEAPNAEAVRDLVFKSGLNAWNDMTIYPVSQVEDLMKRIDEFPLIE